MLYLLDTLQTTSINPIFQQIPQPLEQSANPHGLKRPRYSNKADLSRLVRFRGLCRRSPDVYVGAVMGIVEGRVEGYPRVGLRELKEPETEVKELKVLLLKLP